MLTEIKPYEKMRKIIIMLSMILLTGLVSGYDGAYDINCTNMTQKSVFNLNGSDGFIIPGTAGAEYVLAACYGTDMQVRYNSGDDTDYIVANSTHTDVPFVVVSGNGTTVNNASLFSGDDIKAFYKCDSGVIDLTGVNSDGLDTCTCSSTAAMWGRDYLFCNLNNDQTIDYAFDPEDLGTTQFWKLHNAVGSSGVSYTYAGDGSGVVYIAHPWIATTYRYLDTGWHTIGTAAEGTWNLNTYVTSGFSGTYDIWQGTSELQSNAAFRSSSSNNGNIKFNNHDFSSGSYFRYDNIVLYGDDRTATEITEKVQNNANAIGFGDMTPGSLPPTNTCSCPGPDQNWQINMSDYCNITNCDTGTGNINFTGTGETRCNGSINTTGMGDPGSGNILWIDSNCIIIVN